MVQASKQVHAADMCSSTGPLCDLRWRGVSFVTSPCSACAGSACMPATVRCSASFGSMSQLPAPPVAAAAQPSTCCIWRVVGSGTFQPLARVWVVAPQGQGEPEDES
jgi:hypothetical protein